MDPFHFACPHCSSRLRVREKLYVGRQVDCPECGDTLLIVERDGELAVERVEREAPAALPAGKRAPPGQQEAASKTTTGGDATARGAAVSQTAGAAPVAAPPSAGALPVQGLVRRIFADRRRAVVTLGAASALVALLLTMIFVRHSRDTTGQRDGTSPQVADDQAATSMTSGTGDEKAAPDNPQRTASSEQQPDEYGARRSNDSESPLDDSEAVAGEGGPSPLEMEDVLSDDRGADDRPIDPDFAPEPAGPAARKIDLAASLKQPIARFDQPRSKPLEEVLVSVAEMAGARVTVDRDELGPAAARLDEPMALKLEDTTVGEILSGLLRPAGLAYRIDGDRLHIIRAEGE